MTGCVYILIHGRFEYRIMGIKGPPPSFIMDSPIVKEGRVLYASSLSSLADFMKTTTVIAKDCEISLR